MAMLIYSTNLNLHKKESSKWSSLVFSFFILSTILLKYQHFLIENNLSVSYEQINYQIRELTNYV